jgi:hypothetical protein
MSASRKSPLQVPFMPWVKSTFDISQRSANEYMRISIVYGDSGQHSRHAANSARITYPERVLAVLSAPCCRREPGPEVIASYPRFALLSMPIQASRIERHPKPQQILCNVSYKKGHKAACGLLREAGQAMSLQRRRGGCLADTKKEPYHP